VNYWIDLFTGTTWSEFRAAGASTSGFSANRARQVGRVQPGDILLCYVTGIMRWVGALRVVGPVNDDRQIWHERAFPVRLQVQPEMMLDPENGIPMEQLAGRVSFFANPKNARGYNGVLRASPGLLRNDDGDLILEMLREQARSPVSRPVDRKKLEKRLYPVTGTFGQTKVSIEVSVPDTPSSGPTPVPAGEEAAATGRKHTEIQYQLMRLGGQMKLGLWVARNDRSQNWGEEVLGTMKGTVSQLPTQFDEATQRTIELIDVLWLKNNAIVAAFEVEDTTSVYSGLLRMSDLLALQPNLDVALYLVAPDDRREKVRQEMLRPTFNLREKPLGRVCGFISYSKLQEKVEGINRLGLGGSLNPTFLRDLAEYFVS